MIKKDNKRIMITLSKEYIDTLKIIQYDLHTRQVSKAVIFLIDYYLKNRIA